MNKMLLPLLALALGSTQLPAQPVITGQPTNQIAISGSNVIFNVITTGVGPFAYQWQFNGTNLPTTNIITTVAGTNVSGFSGDGGAASNARINFPCGVTADAYGNFFIADTSNNRIRRVNTNGFITTVAGTNSSGFSGDGGAATNAKLFSPSGEALDAFGNFFIADTSNGRIRRVDTNGIITTVAGTSTRGFYGDGGAATNALLSSPFGVAVDVFGNLFIADPNNSRIRKVDTNGIITTVAGTNSAGFSGDGGAATIAKLNSPYGIAVDVFGNLFIADSGNSRIRKVDTNGIITTVAGTNSAGFSGDGGAATNAKLNTPYGVALDAFGNLFIADSGNSRIRKVDTNGIITTVAGTNSAGFSGDGGAATNAKLNTPYGVVFDTFDNLLIADYNNSRIRKVNLSGSPLLVLPNVTTANSGIYSVVITSPSGSVTSSNVSLSVGFPPSLSAQSQSLAVTNGASSSLTVVISGSLPLSYQWFFNANTMGAGGTNATLPVVNVTTNQAGSYFCVVTNLYGSVTSQVINLSIGTPPMITTPLTNQISYSGSNVTLTVAVSGTGPFSYLWQLNGINLVNNIISTVAGGGVNNPGDGGPATNASVGFPWSMAVDGLGNLFIADSGSCHIRKVDANGIITTVAGNGTTTNNFSGDGGAATNAGLSSPYGVAVDAMADIFITDTYNYRIRKVNASGIITTVAGNGSKSYSGDGGAATNASVNAPQGLALDATGNLFIADTSNNRIRKLDTNGIITTVAGNGTASYSGDGGAATNAGLQLPYAVALDTMGNLFIADNSNNRIRKVDTNGIITTVAGNGSSSTSYSTSNDGHAATNVALSFLYGVAVDSTGDLFIDDYIAEVILKVDPNGIISKAAGKAQTGYSGDGGPATSAGLFYPGGVALDSIGNLFIADAGDHRIRKVSYAGTSTETLNNVNTSSAGDYQVIITGPFGSVTSSIVTLTVITTPLLASTVANADGTVMLNLSSTTNVSSRVYVTTNLTPPVVWQPIYTNPVGGAWQFTDTNAPNYPAQFYRVSTP